MLKAKLTRAGSWLASLTHAFEAASASTGDLLERDYAVAGQSLRLRFAGSALLEALTPAFEHLEQYDGAAPDLIVNLWDSGKDRPSPPLPPIRFDEEAPGALYHYADDAGRAVYQRGIDAVSALSSNLSSAFYWVNRTDSLPYWERAAPIRQILFWWLGAHGVQQLHAASVGTDRGGVLLAGKAGSGKSTAALSAIGSWLGYAGDDYVAVEMQPSPWVHSLYNSGKLDPGNMQRLPLVASCLDNPDRLDSEKAVVYVHQHYPASTTSGFPLRALLLPRVTERAEPRFIEMSPAAALAALAPSTIFQLHTAGQDALAKMSVIVRNVPSFVFEVGPDVSLIPQAVTDLVESLTP